MLESEGSAHILAIPTERHTKFEQHWEQSVLPNKSTDKSSPAPTQLGRELSDGL